jgi:hypothetical protein
MIATARATKMDSGASFPLFRKLPQACEVDQRAQYPQNTLCLGENFKAHRWESSRKLNELISCAGKSLGRI